MAGPKLPQDQSTKRGGNVPDEFKASRFFLTYFGVLALTTNVAVPLRIVDQFCDDIAKQMKVSYVRERGLPRLVDLARENFIYPAMDAEYWGGAKVINLRILDPEKATSTSEQTEINKKPVGLDGAIDEGAIVERGEVDKETSLRDGTEPSPTVIDCAKPAIRIHKAT